MAATDVRGKILLLFLAAVQRSDLRDALEWGEYLLSRKNDHKKGEEL